MHFEFLNSLIALASKHAKWASISLLQRFILVLYDFMALYFGLTLVALYSEKSTQRVI